MRFGEESDVVDGWLDRFENTLLVAQLDEPREQQAFGHWLDQAAIRQEGRRGRVSEAQPVIAPLVWLVLVIAGVLTVAFVVLFADRRERLFAQGFMVVAVTTLVAAGLVIVSFLDHPYGDHSGSIRPTAMQATLESMEETIDVDSRALVECDAAGHPD